MGGLPGTIYRFIYFIKNNNILSSIHNCHTLDLILHPLPPSCGRGGWAKLFYFLAGLCAVVVGHFFSLRQWYVAIVLRCQYLWKSEEVVKIEISLFVSLYVNINKLFHS